MAKHTFLPKASTAAYTSWRLKGLSNSLAIQRLTFFFITHHNVVLKANYDISFVTCLDDLFVLLLYLLYPWWLFDCLVFALQYVIVCLVCIFMKQPKPPTPQANTIEHCYVRMLNSGVTSL